MSYSRYANETSTLLGKIKPPSDVDSFTGTILPKLGGILLNWDAISDIDFREYVIKYQYSIDEIVSSPAWGAEDLGVFNVVGTTYTVSLSDIGYYYFLIKAVDTTGNYSETATSVPVTIVATSFKVDQDYTSITSADDADTEGVNYLLTIDDESFSVYYNGTSVLRNVSMLETRYASALQGLNTTDGSVTSVTNFSTVSYSNGDALKFRGTVSYYSIAAPASSTDYTWEESNIGEDSVTVLIQWIAGNPDMRDNIGSATAKAFLVIGGTKQADIEISGSPISSYTWYYTASTGSRTKILNNTVENVTGTDNNNTNGGEVALDPFPFKTIIFEADGLGLNQTTSGELLLECEIEYTL